MTTNSTKADAAVVAKFVEYGRVCGSTIKTAATDLKAAGKSQAETLQNAFTLGYFMGRTGATEALAKSKLARGATRTAAEVAVMATSRSIWRHVMNLAGFETTKKQGGKRKARAGAKGKPKMAAPSNGKARADAEHLSREIILPTFKDAAEADGWISTVVEMVRAAQRANAKVITGDSAFARVLAAMNDATKARTVTPATQAA